MLEKETNKLKNKRKRFKFLASILLVISISQFVLFHSLESSADTLNNIESTLQDTLEQSKEKAILEIQKEADTLILKLENIKHDSIIERDVSIKLLDDTLLTNIDNINASQSAEEVNVALSVAKEEISKILNNEIISHSKDDAIKTINQMTDESIKELEGYSNIPDDRNDKFINILNDMRKYYIELIKEFSTVSEIDNKVIEFKSLDLFYRMAYIFIDTVNGIANSAIDSINSLDNLSDKQKEDAKIEIQILLGNVENDYYDVSDDEAEAVLLETYKEDIDNIVSKYTLLSTSNPNVENSSSQSNADMSIINETSGTLTSTNMTTTAGDSSTSSYSSLPKTSDTNDLALKTIGSILIIVSVILMTPIVKLS